jgi:hypothetical protein
VVPFRAPASGGGYSLSSGAPCTSRGCRNGLPLKRRMVASSTRRSAMAMACAGDGRNSPQLLKGKFETILWNHGVKLLVTREGG